MSADAILHRNVCRDKRTPAQWYQGTEGKRAVLPQRVQSPPSVQAGIGLKLLIPASIHDSLLGFKMSSAGKCVLPQLHMFFSLTA